MLISVYPDIETLSREAAHYLIRAAKEAITQNGRFTIALSGGTTPRKLFHLLAQEPYSSSIDWALVEVFWADERCVPPESPESSYQLAQETLLSKVPIPANQIHRMPADEADRNAASSKHTQELRNIFGTDGVPVFDVIQLGMGPEGHTASLFPHQNSLHEQERLVMPVHVPKPPPNRLTLTPPVLNAARRILFLVTGADKAEAVQAVIEGTYQPDEYPAQLVRPPKGEVTWMFDTAAAKKLHNR